jgi:DNA polymerase-3 subunit epsilon
MMPISMQDLLFTLQAKAENRLGVTLVPDPDNGRSWVKVDSYAMILILLFLLERIRQETGEHRYVCRFSGEEDFASFDFLWTGEAIKLEKLREWEAQELNLAEEGMPLHLKEVLDHHNAEIWSFVVDPQARQACLRIYLPVFRPQEQELIRRAVVLPDSRPEFYEFDLFNQPGQKPDLDARLLTELVYTVFDTETTGLDPSGGDEIVSIGALRIVSGHIRKEESFDSLVNPKRSIPMTATKIHGISDSMVETQPIIEDVLPAFYQYAEDTILVGHNAAFDMRMLEMYESRTGIKFINPVLDTLLLSAVVHPAQEDQTLAAIADRLGVPLTGRHTAMGDALMTARILIKLIPLLVNKGIQTLGEARDASQKTYYARLKF